MSKKRYIIPVIILLVVLLIVSVSCTCWFGGGRDSIRAMEKVPVASTSFLFWDIEKIRSDEELWGIYEGYRESSEVKKLRELGMTLSKVDYHARASGFSQADIVAGDFDLDAIRDKLEEQGFDKFTYREVEVYTLAGNQPFEALALMKGILIVGSEGDVKACIDVIKGEEERSLSDDEHARAVIDRLPEGIKIEIDKTGAGFDDLLAYGISYEKESADILKIRAIYKFEDEYAAGKAMQAIETALGQKKFFEIELKRDGHFVEAKAKMNLADFSYP